MLNIGLLIVNSRIHYLLCPHSAEIYGVYWDIEVPNEFLKRYLCIVSELAGIVVLLVLLIMSTL